MLPGFAHIEIKPDHQYEAQRNTAIRTRPPDHSYLSFSSYNIRLDFSESAACNGMELVEYIRKSPCLMEATKISSPANRWRFGSITRRPGESQSFCGAIYTNKVKGLSCEHGYAPHSAALQFYCGKRQISGANITQFHTALFIRVSPITYPGSVPQNASGIFCFWTGKTLWNL